MQATTMVSFPFAGGNGRFENLILPHRCALYAQAQRLTGNVTDAEDLVQETLVRAFTRCEQLQGSETTAAWLYTMQRNLFINIYRKRQKAPTVIDLTEERKETVCGRHASSESAEAVVTRTMEYQAVRQALAELPVRYRQILHLAEIEQLSYQEISERMNMPIGTIRSRIARGRQRLQRTLWGWRS